MLYDFTFVIDGADPSDDNVVEVLTEELDATLARAAGVDLLLIAAEGPTAVSAAQNAMRSVEYIAPQIKFLHVDRDLVGISEIAERAGRSRQNVTQWVNGERHGAASTPFPKVEGVAGRARIWLWAEVNAWLKILDLGDPTPGPSRRDITDIDFLIQHRAWLTQVYQVANSVWPLVYLERSHELATPLAGSSAALTENAVVKNFFMLGSTTFTYECCVSPSAVTTITTQILGTAS